MQISYSSVIVVSTRLRLTSTPLVACLKVLRRIESWCTDADAGVFPIVRRWRYARASSFEERRHLCSLAIIASQSPHPTFNPRRLSFFGRWFIPGGCGTLCRRMSRWRRHWLFGRKRHRTHLFKRFFPQSIGQSTVTTESSENGAITLSRMNFYVYVRHVTIFSWMLTTASCLQC